MPSSDCAVASCRNRYSKTRGKGISYHRFPREDSALKAWVAVCRRSDEFDPEKCTICSEHFRSDDFERDLRSELLGLQTKKILKPNAFPTLKLPDKDGMNPSFEKRCRKNGKKDLSNESTESNSGLSSDADIGEISAALKRIQDENEKLKRENARLQIKAMEAIFLPESTRVVFPGFLPKSPQRDETEIAKESTDMYGNAYLSPLTSSSLKASSAVFPTLKLGGPTEKPSPLSSTERVRLWRERQNNPKEQNDELILQKKEHPQWKRDRPPPLTPYERLKRYRERKKQQKKLQSEGILNEESQTVIPLIQHDLSSNDETEITDKNQWTADDLTTILVCDYNS
ncbi:THAP domain-containing protein 4 [Caerostris darwini]|uniref:THAP domain-containing protein 4 n=1 Tax=Caerostris darwini TaxID=1538125 RepID=A0AAV4VGV4_9ARAC|nr:THAP domain-containing protein 4 [Caerostris darwini]